MIMIFLRMIQNNFVIAPSIVESWRQVPEAQINCTANKEGDDNHFHLDPIGDRQRPQMTICN